MTLYRRGSENKSVTVVESHLEEALAALACPDAIVLTNSVVAANGTRLELFSWMCRLRRRAVVTWRSSELTARWRHRRSWCRRRHWRHGWTDWTGCWFTATDTVTETPNVIFYTYIWINGNVSRKQIYDNYSPETLAACQVRHIAKITLERCLLNGSNSLRTHRIYVVRSLQAYVATSALLGTDHAIVKTLHELNLLKVGDQFLNDTLFDFFWYISITCKQIFEERERSLTWPSFRDHHWSSRRHLARCRFDDVRQWTSDVSAVPWRHQLQFRSTMTVPCQRGTGSDSGLLGCRLRRKAEMSNGRRHRGGREWRRRSVVMITNRRKVHLSRDWMWGWRVKVRMTQVLRMERFRGASRLLVKTHVRETTWQRLTPEEQK